MLKLIKNIFFSFIFLSLFKSNNVITIDIFSPFDNFLSQLWNTKNYFINPHTHSKIYTENFQYSNYQTHLENYQNLAQNFPFFVNFTSINQIYPQIKLSQEETYKCHLNQTCIIPIITITNKTTHTHTKPQVFISGALHGDEIAGVEMAWQFAKMLVEGYYEHPFIKYIVDNVSIVIMPFPNAYGFYHFSRFEHNGEDPNRDFGPKSAGKFSTFASKSIHHVFYDHLFLSAITWHGGTAGITYEWGTYEHCEQQGFGWISTESPDMTAQTIVAKYLFYAAKTSNVFYEVGPMCDVVYPVYGGMEDWAYSASWLPESYPNDEVLYEGAPMPPYNDHSFRASTFLIETHISKQPEKLGKLIEVYYPSSDEGVVSQNLRMALQFVAFAHPQILIEATDNYVDITHGFCSTAIGVGCEIVSEVKFILFEGMCAAVTSEMTPIHTHTLKDEIQCINLAVWEYPELTHFFSYHTKKFHIPISFSHTLNAGNYCGKIAGKFDQHWGHQNNPNPPLEPQTLLSILKLEEGYKATTENGNYSFESHIEWYFPKHNGYQGIDMYVLE